MLILLSEVLYGYLSWYSSPTCVKHTYNYLQNVYSDILNYHPIPFEIHINRTCILNDSFMLALINDTIKLTTNFKSVSEFTLKCHSLIDSGQFRHCAHLQILQYGIILGS